MLYKRWAVVSCLVGLAVGCGVGGPSRASEATPGVLPVSGRMTTPFVTGHPKTAPLLEKTDMVDSQEGFAASGDAPATLLRTRNGGKTWTPLYHASTDIAQIAFVSAKVGYLLEGGHIAESGSPAPSTLWVTHNGGTSWTPLHHFRTPITSLDVINQNVSWAVGDNGTSWSLRKSVDGGRSWQGMTDPKVRLASSEVVSFINPLQGWLAVGGGASAGSQDKTLYKTTNGGGAWSREAVQSGLGGSVGGTLPLAGYVSGLDFVTPRVGFMTLARSGLAETRDGGRHWFSPPQPLVGSDRASVDFWSPEDGYLQEGTGAGNGAPLYVTQDGGSSWKRRYPGVLPALDVPVAGSRDWLGLGDLSGISETLIQVSNNEGKSWRVQANAPTGTDRLVALGSKRWMAIGAEVSVTTDAGGHWTHLRLPGPINSQNVAVATRHTMWAFVDNKGLYMTHDGGKHWGLSVPAKRLPFQPTALAVTPDGTGYALGASIPVHRSAEATGGKVGTPDAVHLKLWVTRDGGHRWKGYALPSWHIFDMAWNGYSGILWSGHRYWVTIDGGRRWKGYHWPTGWNVQTVAVMGPSHLVAMVGSISTSRVIPYHSLDDGKAWITGD